MEIVSQFPSFAWEVNLIAFLQEHMGVVGEYFAVLFTLCGEQLAAVLVLGFLYWCYDKELARRVGMTALSAMLWCVMLKNTFIRRRPYMDHSEIRCIRPAEKGDIYDVLAQGYSFPSGHATLSAGLYWKLASAAKAKWARAVFTLLPILVGISRFCLGVHYPTDVLAGLALGACGLLLGKVLEKYVKNDAVSDLILLVLVLPGIFFCKSNDYFTLLGVMIGYMAGIVFEKRYVSFENTRSFRLCALRLAGGVAVYFVLNVLLKAPFDAAFLESGTLAALLVRTGRYAVILFADIGLYPLLFQKLEKRFSRKKDGENNAI